MQVTFLTRFDGSLFFGGAEVQALKTAAALRELGVHVEFLHPFSKEVGDIVHAFGSYHFYESTLIYCKNIYKNFVISTIFYKDVHNPFLKFRYYVYIILPRLNRQARRIGRLLALSDMLLPNSRKEAQQLSDLFRIPQSKIQVVPNGVEERFAYADPTLFRREVGIEEPFVLNVGRIEPGKNQHRLIQALNSTKIPLVIIGKNVNNNYYSMCKEVAKDNVYFLPPVPHESPLLASAYSACRVFALPSLSETTGLSALEAGVAGARVVVTPNGGAPEYFQNFGFYPNPFSIKSIREAVLQAWESNVDTHAQREHLLSNYEWKVVAQRTLECYHRVLSGE